MSVDYRPEYDPADVNSDYGHTGGNITVPTFTGDTRPFRFWCQKALPLVYDDSLSYYEVLCKMADYMNNFMTDLTTVEDSMTEFGQQFVINQQFLNDMADQLGQNVADLEAYINARMDDFMAAYTQLQTYVNNYFDNLDVQEEINTKLDEMASDGTLNDLFDPVLETWMQQKTAQIDAAIAGQDAIQAAQNARISVLEGRMDTFSGLPSGSTSGNAELLDIRTNFLGETYPTAGDAVRASDMIASGFQAISATQLEDWDGNVSSSVYYTVQIDISGYKGGHVVVIGSFENFKADIENTGTCSVYATNTPGKTSDTNAVNYFPGSANSIFTNYTQITTSISGEERLLLQFAIPDDFAYQYLKIGHITDRINPGYFTEPRYIVYANSWSKTQVDPTLSIAGAAADAKAAGDAIDELNERIDNVNADFSYNGLLADVVYTDLDGFITNRGDVTSNAFWGHTEPIHLNKMETIFLRGTSVNSGIAMISLVTSEGTILNPVVFGADNAERNYQYTAVDDCYVSVSHRLAETNIKKGVSVETVQQINAVLEDYTGKNLLDSNDTIDNYYISNGSIASQDGFCYTKHLIPCKPNTAYATTHNGTIFICYYDEDKEYLSGTTANQTTFITPNDCYFMRISFAMSHKNDCMICLATEKNRTYAPYVHGYNIKNIPNAHQMNHIYVGTGKQYQTITSALAAIVDASEYNRYTIHVSPGTYSETFSTKDYVDIVGEDKYKCIIDYTNPDESQYVNRSTIFATSYTTLKNLTISTTGSKYPVHSDGAYGVPYRVRIENCILKHNGFTTLPTQAGTAIGIGLYEYQHVEIIDSECIASGVFGCASIYCHNSDGPEARSGYRSIRVEHTTLSNSTYGFRIEALENNNYQDNDAWLIGIINNGQTPIRNTHVSKDSWHLFQYE